MFDLDLCKCEVFAVWSNIYIRCSILKVQGEHYDPAMYEQILIIVIIYIIQIASIYFVYVRESLTNE